MRKIMALMISLALIVSILSPVKQASAYTRGTEEITDVYEMGDNINRALLWSYDNERTLVTSYGSCWFWLEEPGSPTINKAQPLETSGLTATSCYKPLQPILGSITIELGEKFDFKGYIEELNKNVVGKISSGPKHYSTMPNGDVSSSKLIKYWNVANNDIIKIDGTSIVGLKTGTTIIEVYLFTSRTSVHFSRILVNVVDSSRKAKTYTGITKANYNKIAIGDTVKLGKYEQDNVDNGMETVKWEVIAVESGVTQFEHQTVLERNGLIGKKGSLNLEYPVYCYTLASKNTLDYVPYSDEFDQDITDCYQEVINSIVGDYEYQRGHYAGYTWSDTAYYKTRKHEDGYVKHTLYNHYRNDIKLEVYPYVLEAETTYLFYMPESHEQALLSVLPSTLNGTPKLTQYAAARSGLKKSSKIATWILTGDEEAVSAEPNNYNSPYDSMNYTVEPTINALGYTYTGKKLVNESYGTEAGFRPIIKVYVYPYWELKE